MSTGSQLWSTRAGQQRLHGGITSSSLLLRKEELINLEPQLEHCRLLTFKLQNLRMVQSLCQSLLGFESYRTCRPGLTSVPACMCLLWSPSVHPQTHAATSASTGWMIHRSGGVVIVTYLPISAAPVLKKSTADLMSYMNWSCGM